VSRIAATEIPEWSTHDRDQGVTSPGWGYTAVLGGLKVNGMIAKRIMLVLSAIALAAVASACDFSNEEGGHVHNPAVLPTPAVLTSTY
jgi:hypothetical protein